MWCLQQELQRFPRLHAQLIEVVSELLRERLGPTSEYAQSLIEIQAAYINTNHPAFISGSAMAVEQAAHSPPKQLPPPPRVSIPHVWHITRLFIRSRIAAGICRANQWRTLARRR